MRKTERGFMWEDVFLAYPFFGVAVKWRLHISQAIIEDKKLIYRINESSDCITQ